MLAGRQWFMPEDFEAMPEMRRPELLELRHGAE
jgi:hypothetical protein